jgi:hypothetical protein|tara:strand:- start:1292 stop:1723 length:432 start_codon:yes stop_codon:yes gene_type:complete
MNILSSVDFWKFAVPLLVAVVAWFANEWQKRLSNQHLRKEESYRQLLESLKGFYIGATNAGELRAEFLNQMNIAWLYCPDDIIKKGYIFLDTVHTKQTRTDEAKEKAMGAFVAAIRQDILTRKLVYKSSLSSNDFIHIGITKL